MASRGKFLVVSQSPLAPFSQFDEACSCNFFNSFVNQSIASRSSLVTVPFATSSSIACPLTFLMCWFPIPRLRTAFQTCSHRSPSTCRPHALPKGLPLEVMAPLVFFPKVSFCGFYEPEGFVEHAGAVGCVHVSAWYR